MPFFSFFFIFLILLILPGIVMGWIAAGNIRRSDGELYGMRLAVFAALFVPGLLLLALPVIAFAIVLRFCSFSLSMGDGDAMLWAGPAFVTTLFLSLKVFQGCLAHLLGKDSFRQLFGLKKNRWVLSFLVLMWGALGIIFFLQRPLLDGKVSQAESPNRMFIAKGSTWRRMRIFGKDETSYRFEIVGQGERYHQRWEAPIPVARLATDYVNVPNVNFGEKGTIHWDEEGRNVQFRVNGQEVFRASVDDSNDLHGSASVISR
ncbi:MAG: hypothetical protein ACSHYB_03345 [Roseibacillus sp.]